MLIDLSGVIYEGERLLPGAAEAVARLRAAGLPCRFLTNTTSKPRRAILDQLAWFGLRVAAPDVITPAAAAVNWMAKRGLAPHLLIHPRLAPDFEACRADGQKAVLVGDAREFFTYARINAAFRAVAEGAPLVALAKNRVFRDADGALSIDAGAFVTALEYAAGVEAELMGKPAPAFFAAAAASMGCSLGDVAMIGDDAEADVAGGLSAGVGQAVLVKTGKYRDGDEDRVSPRPSAVAAGIGEAVEAVLGQAATA